MGVVLGATVASECGTYGLMKPRGEVTVLVSPPFSLKAQLGSTVTPLPRNRCWRKRRESNLPSAEQGHLHATLH